MPARSAPRARVELRHLGKLLEEPALLAAGLLRDDDLDGGVEVAVQALAAQAQPPPGGGAGRHLDRGLAVERWDLDGRSERGLPRRHREVDVEVAAVDPEAPVRAQPDPQHHSGRAQALTVAHARRDADLDLALARDLQALPATLLRLLERELEDVLGLDVAHREAAAAEQALEQVAH